MSAPIREVLSWQAVSLAVWEGLPGPGSYYLTANELRQSRRSRLLFRTNHCALFPVCVVNLPMGGWGVLSLVAAHGSGPESPRLLDYGTQQSVGSGEEIWAITSP
jgi:hypothetical protein